MNPYEILGVPKDATPADIRKAFRAQAAKHHPDKGGDGEDMSELNVAYETLNDPEKRKRYDATGDCEPPSKLQSAAEELVMTLFVQATDQAPDADVLDAIANHLRGIHVEAHRNAASYRDRLTKLAKIRKRYKHKGGRRDFLNLFFEKRREQFEQAVKQCEKQAEVALRACELIQEYEFLAEEQPKYWRTVTYTI
jgi:DnaJ-class molecular chaperone